MKKFTLACISLSFLFACTETPKNHDATDTQAVNADSAAVADVIHGFYQWYDGFIRDEATDVNFTNTDGEHLTLNQSALEAYYTHFKNTGFVSDEFVDNEFAFYKKCEALWQNEPVDEVPSCLDADKYFCAQDWETEFWTTSPVRITPMGADRVTATLYGAEAGSPQERSFELKKENGKWMLSKIECDMGVQ